MGVLDSVQAWFDAHVGIRKFVKNAVLAALGFILAQQANILQDVPPDKLAYAMAVFGALGWVLHRLQTSTTWPIVGAGKRKK